MVRALAWPVQRGRCAGCRRQLGSLMVGCRNRVLANVLTGALAAGLVLSVGQGKPIAAERGTGSGAKAVAPAGAQRGAQAAGAQAGAQVYALRCSGCHGVELNNTSGGQVFDLRKLRPEDHDRFVDSVLFRERHLAEAAIRFLAHDSSYITDAAVLLSRCVKTVQRYTHAHGTGV